MLVGFYRKLAASAFFDVAGTGAAFSLLRSISLIRASSLLDGARMIMAKIMATAPADSD